MDVDKRRLVEVGLIVVIAAAVIQNPLSSQYVYGLKDAALEVAVSQNQLYSDIEKAAQQFSIPPQNAKIDKVWKTIPGYNGLEVDIKASYEKMKKSKKFNEQKLIFKQIPPSVHLKDLPPSPIYKGNPDKPMVSLLINVAWGNEYLPDMLATLKKNDVKATFFLEGRWVKENPNLAKMIVEAGNEVGNHSYSHPDMKKLTNGRITEELQKTNDVIEATTGEKVKWFAPPSGSYREEVVNIASGLHLGTIMWSVDTIDWQKPSPQVLLQRVTSKVHPGAMILMHPTESSSQALDALIKEIKKKQLRFGTVSDLVNEERIIKLPSPLSEKQ
ncbi:polysaccharide deacetylase family protein [Falsibacillus pallidus]|uniref:polysaccharide deacetylase family protein n=1 Tax=Falsibacillus pallidus TaxID=493781 RepID=UPI000E0BCE46|nr:polysaccharide deacetylase family protein [Falsibacillus pallidus]